MSTENKEENAVLKNELRKSTMKIAELEMKLTVSPPYIQSIPGIDAVIQMNGSNASLDPSKIEEQKSVMAGLESEREARIKELEMLAAAKEVFVLLLSILNMKCG